MQKHYHVIILGAGDLGSRLALQLHHQNQSVLAIKRTPDVTPRPYAMAYLDLTGNTEALAELSCNVLIYSVAAASQMPESYRQSYYHGLHHALQRVQHQHCIFVSSTRVYGQADADWVTEQTPAQPADEQGHILLAAEGLLTDNDCSVRLAGIYGPQRTRMIRLARQGSWLDQLTFSNRIHIEDAVALIGFLCNRWQSGLSNPVVVLGCDGEGASHEQVLQWLRERLNVPPQASAKLTMPVGKRCRSAWLQNNGFQFSYPDFRSGYEALLEDELRI